MSNHSSTVLPAPADSGPSERRSPPHSRSQLRTGLIILDLPSCDQIYGSECQAEIARRLNLLAMPMDAEQALGRPDLLAEAEVIFSGWGAPRLDAEFLALMPKLQAVFYGAGSIRDIVTEDFWARKIPITSAYAINAVPVAEYTMAAILLSLKNFWSQSYSAKLNGRFPTRTICAGAFGSKIGIISLGMIGRLVRERLRTFDLEVLAYDPFVSAEQATALGVRLASLDEIFTECDVASLHTPWLKETEGMIRGRHIASMKARATFINTARGALVREEEMIEALKYRPDITAWLDVTHPEPPLPGSPLWTMPNVVLTPHIAGSRDRECSRMGRVMIEEFDRWQRGKPLLWEIARQVS